MVTPFQRALAGGGDMGDRVRRLDWAATPVGPIEAWPQTLRTALTLLLADRCPRALAWGPELTLFYNDAFRPLLGAARELVGQPAAIALAPRWPGLAPRLADVVAGRLVDPDDLPGDTHYTCSFSPIHDEADAVAGVLLTAAPARERVHGTRARLYAHFMQAPVAVSVVVGPEFVYDLANPLYERMVGRAGITGKSMRAAFPELPPDADVYSVLRRVYASGAPFSAAEYRIAVADTERFFNFTLQPLHDDLGRVDGVMTVGVDVTDQVVARREALAARAEAEVANRAKDEFLAMLGHELRNPLAPIRTALQLMHMRDDTTLKHERTILERQVDHLTRLVDDLLDVSRVARGKIDLKRERLELADVVARAVEMVGPRIAERGQRLTVDVPRQGLRVDADPVRLAQVVSNLLHNATKFSDVRGQIAVTAAREGLDAVLRVRDDGIGLGPAILPRVFDLFMQARQPSDRARGGLGLGLAIARNLVELHGGTIAAHSDGPGTGATFTVRLPAADPEARPAPAAAPEPAGPAVPTRVLVVDDNADAADLMGEALRLLGYHVEVACDGPAALAVAAAFAPDVALLDIGLPGMDGHELAARLRAQAGASIRLVAVTGYGQPADRQRSLAYGFDEHLVKPIELAVLADRLAALTGARA